MENVNIKINGMPLSVPNGISILEAARYAGIEIIKAIVFVAVVKCVALKDLFLRRDLSRGFYT